MKSSFKPQYSQVSEPGQYSEVLEVCNFSVHDFDLLWPVPAIQDKTVWLPSRLPHSAVTLQVTFSSVKPSLVKWGWLLSCCMEWDLPSLCVCVCVCARARVRACMRACMRERAVRTVTTHPINLCQHTAHFISQCCHLESLLCHFAVLNIHLYFCDV
jgi:hypothetical protein